MLCMTWVVDVAPSNSTHHVTPECKIRLEVPLAFASST